MGRTSAPRRRVAVLSTSTRRWSRRGREVLLGKQDLPKSATAPVAGLDARALVTLAGHWYTPCPGLICMCRRTETVLHLHGRRLL